jgi:putative membrane protein
MSSLFAFLHFVAAFGLAATLFLEWQTVNPSPTHAEAVRLQRVDAWYGLFAVVVLVAGTLRVMVFEKGHAFYTGNPFFHAKIGLFVAIDLLSIYPTVRFVKWRPQTRQGLAPVVSADEYRRLRLVLRLEVLLLVALLLCASLMARGVGLRVA